MVHKVLIAYHANKGRSKGLCACLNYHAAQNGRDDIVFESAGIDINDMILY